MICNGHQWPLLTNSFVSPRVDGEHLAVEKLYPISIQRVSVVGDGKLWDYYISITLYQNDLKKSLLLIIINFQQNKWNSYEYSQWTITKDGSSINILQYQAIYKFLQHFLKISTASIYFDTFIFIKRLLIPSPCTTHKVCLSVDEIVSCDLHFYHCCVESADQGINYKEPHPFSSKCEICLDYILPSVLDWK